MKKEDRKVVRMRPVETRRADHAAQCAICTKQAQREKKK